MTLCEAITTIDNNKITWCAYISAYFYMSYIHSEHFEADLLTRDLWKCKGFLHKVLTLQVEWKVLGPVSLIMNLFVYEDKPINRRFTITKDFGIIATVKRNCCYWSREMSLLNYIRSS